MGLYKMSGGWGMLVLFTGSNTSNKTDKGGRHMDSESVFQSGMSWERMRISYGLFWRVVYGMSSSMFLFMDEIWFQ